MQQIRFKFKNFSANITQSGNSKKRYKNNQIYCIWCNKNMLNFALNAKK